MKHEELKTVHEEDPNNPLRMDPPTLQHNQPLELDLLLQDTTTPCNYAYCMLHIPTKRKAACMSFRVSKYATLLLYILMFLDYKSQSA